MCGPALRLLVLATLGTSLGCVRAGFIDPDAETGTGAVDADASGATDGRAPDSSVVDGSAPDARPPATWGLLAEPPNGNPSGSGYTTATNRQIAMARDGSVIVAWVDDSNGNQEVYLKRWDGVSWTALGGSADPGGISRSPTASLLGHVKLDAQDRPYVIFMERDSRRDEFHIYCTHWTGTAWELLRTSGTQPALPTQGNIFWPTGDFDSQGRLVVVWPTLMRTWVVQLARWSGSTWEAVAGSLGSDGIALLPDESADFPNVAFGPGDVLHVAWQATRHADGRTYARHRYLNGETWTELSTPFMARFPTADRPGLVFDGAGQPNIGWTEHPSAVARMARWTGSDWQELKFATGAPLSDGTSDVNSLSVVRGPQDRLYAAWDADDAEGGRAVFVRQWDGTGWRAIGQGANGQVSSGTNPASWPVLVANSTRLYLIWEEAMPGGGIALRIKHIEP